MGGFRRQGVVGVIYRAAAGIVAAVALVAGAVQMIPAAQASTSDSPTVAVSPNWSGYVASGQQGSPVSYSSVTGTWVVPSVTCGPNSAGGLSAVWVGLGGYMTKNQEEVGTDTSCDASGKPIYYAWFELVPYIAYNVPAAEKVLPGDRMTGLVTILSPALVELQIQNQTRGWIFSRNITFSTQGTSTAEWVAEAPASCMRFVCSEANLTNFGSVTMTNISATGNGAVGTLADSDWNVTQVQLVPGRVNVPTLNPEGPQPPQGQASSPAGATPGPASEDGSSLNITWVKEAGGI